MSAVLIASGDDVAAMVRAAASESVVVVIDADLDALALAVAKAQIGPLAIECAPNRINAVVRPSATDPDAVTAAVAFLDRATSTTGQIIEIS